MTAGERLAAIIRQRGQQHRDHAGRPFYVLKVDLLSSSVDDDAEHLLRHLESVKA